MKKRLKTLRAWGKLHPFSRNVLHGSAQFTAVWYLFAGFLHLTAGYTPDYFRAILYRDAALQVAPVTLAAGIVLALLTDLVEKERALMAIVQKYTPQLVEKGLSEARVRGTAVVKITIEHITGKYYRR